MNTSFFVDTVNIYRISSSLDSDRIERNVYVSAYTGTGLLENFNGSDIIRGDKDIVLSECILFMPTTFTPIPSDIVKVNSDYYTIYSIDNHIFRATHQELLLKTAVNNTAVFVDPIVPPDPDLPYVFTASAKITNISIGGGDPETHDNVVSSSFIQGYESTGGVWSGSIHMLGDESSFITYINNAIQSGSKIYIQSTGGASDYEAFCRYNEISTFMPAGSNSSIRIYPFTSGIPRIVISGAGSSSNVTGYDIEFYGRDPISGDTLSSNSNGYVAGQLCYIANYISSSIWTARYLSRQTGETFTNQNGYGKVNINEAIALFTQSVNYTILDPHLNG